MAGAGLGAGAVTRTSVPGPPDRARPERERLGRDGKPPTAVGRIQPVEERPGLSVQAQQGQAAQNPRDSEPVVVGRCPDVRGALGEVWPFGDLDTGHGQAQEGHDAAERFPQVGTKGGVGTEGGDVGWGQQGSVGIELAGFGEGEEPLDKVMDGFEVIVRPGEDVLKCSALRIGGVRVAAVEVDEMGHGADVPWKSC